MPVQEYTTMKPHPTSDKPNGYKCGRCGLEGLIFGEPHLDTIGKVCEPISDGSPTPGEDHDLAIRPHARHFDFGHVARSVEERADNLPDGLLDEISKLPAGEQTSLFQNLRTYNQGRMAQASAVDAAANEPDNDPLLAAQQLPVGGAVPQEHPLDSAQPIEEGVPAVEGVEPPPLDPTPVQQEEGHPLE